MSKELRIVTPTDDLESYDTTSQELTRAKSTMNLSESTSSLFDFETDSQPGDVARALRLRYAGAAESINIDSIQIGNDVLGVDNIQTLSKFKHCEFLPWKLAEPLGSAKCYFKNILKFITKFPTRITAPDGNALYIYIHSSLIICLKLFSKDGDNIVFLIKCTFVFIAEV